MIYYCSPFLIRPVPICQENVATSQRWSLVEGDGWMNQAYSRLSTTHGHITDCLVEGEINILTAVVEIYGIIREGGLC